MSAPAVDPNPLHWSPDIKAISAGLVMIVTIVGSAWKAADYIGGKIYNLAEVQTRTLLEMQTLQAQQTALVPRIDTLEKAVNTAEAAAAAAKARADDMKDDLIDLKKVASQNLAVSVSHSEAINATREKIAPKMLFNSPR
jgi:outer membrane murein-binding lipoprotein Lpp